MIKLVILAILACASSVTRAQNKEHNSNQNPDWAAIQKELNFQHGIKKADSILLVQQVSHYFKMKDYTQYVNAYIRYIQQYNLIGNASEKNSAAWRIFDYGTDSDNLYVAFRWVKLAQNDNPLNAYFLDTYANILYKMGKKSDALDVQRVAVRYSQFNHVFVQNYFKMQASLPTWKYPIVPVIRKQKTEERIWGSIRQEFKRELDSLVWVARIKESQSIDDNSIRTSLLIRYHSEFRPQRNLAQLNEDAWTVFQSSTKKSELNTALVWASISVENQHDKNRYAYLDTYANLLYKLGKHKEAVKWSEQALLLAPETEKVAYSVTLAKIKRGEPTW